MRVRSLLTAAAAAALAAGMAAPASAATGTVVTAHFSHRLTGTSTFTQNADGSITLRGLYAGLPANSWSYSVVYINGNCDPAQAFPIGPFQANAQGVATANITLPSSIDISGTMSASVRRADITNKGVPTDVDHDGKTGKGDVIAVPGKPWIGLRECDAHPAVLP